MKLNVQAPTGSTCACGNWLDHWNKFSGQSAPLLCPMIMCVEKTEVGAHVRKDDNADKTVYIVPLCTKHGSQAGETVAVNDYLPLVSTNLTETCAKP